MSKCPGLYFNFGKKARDLLHKNYGQQPSTHYHYQCLDWNFDFSCQIEEIVPGLNSVFKLIIPDSCKVELQYLHDYFGISGGVGMKANPSRGFEPLLNFSGVIGSSLFSLGTDLAFNLSTRTFSNFNAGLSFNTSFLIASLTLDDNFHSINASCYQALNQLTRTAIAAELKHDFDMNGTTSLAIGAQHGLFPCTLLKARVSTDGKIGALVQQQLWQKLILAFSGEVDFRSKVPNLGLSLVLKP